MVDETLAEAGLAVDDVDAFAFGRGPGSFTGVRIAAGVVQGLAFGADRPVVPVSTLAAHAAAANRIHGVERVAVCVDARLDECYWGLYRVAPAAPPSVLEADTLVRPEALALPGDAGWFGVGSGWARWPELAARLERPAGIDPALLPEASDLLGQAARELAAGRSVAAEAALPVYLREEVAWQRPAKP